MSTTNQTPGKPVRFVVGSQKRIHILSGDHTGGGHRFGAGKGKNEFPSSWSDDDIINAIESVANDPGSTRLTRRAGRAIFINVRNTISVTVVVDVATADIVTGYPT